MCIEHRGEVDVLKMTAKKRREPVLGQVLDPFRSRSVVELGIMAATMVVGHSCVISITNTLDRTWRCDLRKKMCVRAAGSEARPGMSYQRIR